MEDVTAKVARQYTQHAYPQPADDLTAAAAAGAVDFTDPSVYGPLFWPEGPPRPDLDILIAGCGTQQAALIAFNNPAARVVGVDLSDSSLSHQRYLREKHALANLHLYQGDLRRVGEIGRDFDLIISTGVLHHLADPSEGLSAIRSVLREGGAMGLMVYGAGGRAGVYMLQDAFRRMGLGQSKGDIAAVRRLLGGLLKDHPAQAYVQNAAELAHDTAIVDTFLHPQDRAYTVPQLLEWLAESGLALQAWAQNHFYYPEALIEPEARRRIRALPEPEQWAIVEGLLGVPGNHIFSARPAGEEQRVDFSGDGWLSYRPQFKRESGIAETRPDGTGVVGLWGLRFEMNAGEMEVVRQIDGARSIGEILAAPAFAAVPAEQRHDFGRLCIERLWKIGTVMIAFGAATA